MNVRVLIEKRSDGRVRVSGQGVVIRLFAQTKCEGL